MKQDAFCQTPRGLAGYIPPPRSVCDVTDAEAAALRATERLQGELAEARQEAEPGGRTSALASIGGGGEILSSPQFVRENLRENLRLDLSSRTLALSQM